MRFLSPQMSACHDRNFTEGGESRRGQRAVFVQGSGKPWCIYLHLLPKLPKCGERIYHTFIECLGIEHPLISIVFTKLCDCPWLRLDTRRQFFRITILAMSN